MRLRFQSWAKLLRRSVFISASGFGAICGICVYTENETFYRNLMSAFHWTNPEFGHRAAVWSLKHGLVMRTNMKDNPSIAIRLWGLDFKNAVGIAAGFDKHGEAVLGLDKLGFGFVEVGSVTPLPQQGNPRPRVFRLKEDRAVINRYGFNSVGHDEVYTRLEAIKKTGKFGGVLGVNLGKNKLSPSAVGDYVAGVEKFGQVCDYLVINISSPNTPGLRSLQGRRDLSLLLSAVLEARRKLKSQPPILVKIAPDLTDMDKADIAEVIMDPSSRMDGIIISNTTVERPDTLRSSHKGEAGGLSGAPLKDLSTQTIRDLYRLTKGSIPIVGVGGISSGQDAYEKIVGGASLVQLYSALVYQGPTVVNRVRRELQQLLTHNGFNTLEEAVGAQFKQGFGGVKEHVGAQLEVGVGGVKEDVGAQLEVGVGGVKEAVGAQFIEGFVGMKLGNEQGTKL